MCIRDSVKGGSNKDIKYTTAPQGKDSIVKGFGGQYFGDLSNQQLLSDETTDSNILWESFNTKYEVIREGVATDIDGGWAGNSSQSLGVKNTGVAFKGSPVRVFKADSGLEIVDYNVGNISSANKFQGDYSHLPIIKPGEKLDLFFGVRVGKLSDFSEKIQLLFNSDDGTFKGMDGYANYEFDINIPVSKNVIGSEPVKDPTSPVGCKSVWMDSDYVIRHPVYGEIKIESNPKLPEKTWRVNQSVLENFADYPGDGFCFQMSNIASPQTYTFSKPIVNPILVVYSLGRPTINVTIETDKEFADYSGGAVPTRDAPLKILSDNKFSGREGYGMLIFPGEHTSITLTPDVAEHYYDIVWGIQNCP